MGKKGKKGKRKKKKKKKKKKVVKDLCPPIPPPPFELQPTDPCPRKMCDDEADNLIEPQPNHYPGLTKDAVVMAVAGSLEGTYESLCKLVRAGFRCAERVFIMTPWANYVIARAKSKNGLLYYVYDGCTCDVNRFRYMDLSCGTAGFIYFTNLDDVIKYMLHSRGIKMTMKIFNKVNVNDIVSEYGTCESGAGHSCMK